MLPVSSVFASSSKGTEVEMSLSTPVTLSSVQTDCFKLCHLQSKEVALPRSLYHTRASLQVIYNILVWHFLTFFCTFFVPYLPTWGPAGNTWRGYSRLRSGREHWAWMVVVEVRQGTLGGDGRGWGPAGNTGRGWSWLRSGREHWAGMVVVEVRQRTLGVDGRGWGPTENTCVEGRGWAGGGGEERRRGAGNWHKI